jgi:hypothetical protein
MMMDDDLDLTFLNLEFRLMLLEESCKELQERTQKLLTEVDEWASKYSVLNDDEDYWRAD